MTAHQIHYRFYSEVNLCVNWARHNAPNDLIPEQVTSHLLSVIGSIN